MILSILTCLASYVALVALLRRDRVSLGLPTAYLLMTLLSHVPGAWAAFATQGVYGEGVIATGIMLAAIGSVCFVVGVWLAGPLLRMRAKRSERRGFVAPPRRGPEAPPQSLEFQLFCLIGGWVMVYGLSAILRAPSIGAALEKGGAIWILGVMLGLALALQQRAVGKGLLWLLALAVYPTIMLVIGGFLGYGVGVAVIAFAPFVIMPRRFWVVIASVALVSALGISLFVNYFGIRKELRAAAWGGAAIEQRVEIASRIITKFEWFNPQNPDHLFALDARLNQNYFVGVSAERLKLGQVDYLRGRSVWEGAIALVPRLLWPDKPVYGGSPEIVREMTGLHLNENTSWGVGNVMEFYINFGIPGLVGGFLIMGVLLGVLDRRAAEALQAGDSGTLILYFLPAVALIQPNGSIVELTSGGAAALVAAFFWRWTWSVWSRRKPARPMAMPGRLRP